MRFLMRLGLWLALLVVLLWGAAQIFLLQQARSFLAQNPSVRVEGLAALTNPTRIGLTMTRAKLPDGVDVDGGKVWVPTLTPNRVRAELPNTVTLPIAEGNPLIITDGGAELSVSPLNRMALSQAKMTASGLTDGNRHALSGPIYVSANLTPKGADAPAAALSAYRVDLDIDRIKIAPLAAILAAPIAPELDRDVTLKGRALVYLDGTLRPGGNVQPAIAGLHSDQGVTLSLGNDSARLLGRIDRDAQGFAHGDAYLYTADAERFLNLAAALGLMPQGSIKLALTALTTLSAQTPDQPPSNGVMADNGAAPWPPAPAQGEIRLPFRFVDGTAKLGPIPLGPAPRLN